jgi:hypothetical protein
MRNSDDAKLIAGAIEKAGRLISEAIKENTRATMQRTPRYQIPEEASRIFPKSFPSHTISVADFERLTECTAPTDTQTE